MLRCVPIFALSLAACGGGYQADSYQTGAIWGDLRFEGTRLSYGCLDIALRAQESLEGDPTIDVSLGNRCPEALRVDLRKLQIRGHFDGEAPRRLSLFDPNNEIGNALLGGNAAASERLEITGAYGAYELCVSVDAIARTQNAGPPQETCLHVEPAEAS
jgi:hypothetical protein